MTCEPIVSETLWNQVNQIIEEQLKSWSRPGPLPVQTFGTLAQCVCGSKMYVRSGSAKYVCQKCHNKIPMVDLEGVVHDELKGFFASPAKLASHAAEAKRNLAEKEQALAAHEREIAKVREEMARTHRLYLDGHVTPQGFGDFYKPARGTPEPAQCRPAQAASRRGRPAGDGGEQRGSACRSDRALRPLAVDDDRREATDSRIFD